MNKKCMFTCAIYVEGDAISKLYIAVGRKGTVLLLGPLDQTPTLVITQSLHGHTYWLHQRLFCVHFLISLIAGREKNQLH